MQNLAIPMKEYNEEFERFFFSIRESKRISNYLLFNERVKLVARCGAQTNFLNCHLPLFDPTLVSTWNNV
jgi:hypothetical protein